MANTSIVRYNFDGQTVGADLASVSPETQNASYEVSAGDTPVTSGRLVIQANGSLEELGDSLVSSLNQFSPLFNNAGSYSDLNRPNFFTWTGRRAASGTGGAGFAFRSSTSDGTLDDLYFIDVNSTTAVLRKYVNGVNTNTTNFSATYSFTGTYTVTISDDGAANPTFTVTQGATSSTITDSTSPLPIASSYNGLMIYDARNKMVNFEWFVDLAEPGGGGNSAQAERQLVALRLLENEL